MAVGKKRRGKQTNKKKRCESCVFSDEIIELLSTLVK